MHESEIYSDCINEPILDSIKQKFDKTNKEIKFCSVLHWSEHCTECAMPICFSTCDMYTPRVDGKCQRFLRGIQPLEQKINKRSNILKINFKKWAVLETQANHFLYDWNAIKQRERFDFFISQAINKVPWPKALKKRLVKTRYGFKKRHLINTDLSSNVEPDAFIIEVYSPSISSVKVNVVIRNDDEKYRIMPFQYQFSVENGYNKEVIPFKEISKRIKIDLSYRISIIPETSNVDLYFGLTEFVKFERNFQVEEKKQSIKCVVWDLDNTIWKGTLTEDKLEGLSLKPGIIEIFEYLESKGVLQSIASKNDYSLALKALKHFSIENYFLYPKINWEPKSSSIKAIANDFNIGVNSLLFIDDSPFERGEVKSVHSGVSVMDALDYNTIRDIPDFQSEITNDAKKRKELYLDESVRKQSATEFKGEYYDFLRSCSIILTITSLLSENYTRVHELTQRTNQMNFSGNKYREDDIEKLALDNNLDCYVLQCSDQFGGYGTVGFAVINKEQNRLIDLMFSCRIQSKRIEHAFISFCLKKYLIGSDFFVTYKHTDRNKFSAQVFYDFDFSIESEEGSTRHLRFNQSSDIPDDEIVKLEVQL